jgi:hypothetical protein
MATINQVFSKWDKLDFNKVVETTMYESEKDIIYLNVNQMQDGKGSDDAVLKNSNKNLLEEKNRLTKQSKKPGKRNQPFS